ncbi:MAG: hypothetical protein V4662_08085 [Verrucomicrobiota bacterium]
MNNPAAVMMFLSLVALALLPGCTTAPTRYKHIAIATNNGAKLSVEKPLEPGYAIQWLGEVDAKGFATGRGTLTGMDEKGEKDSEYHAHFLNGSASAGPYELLSYLAGQPYTKYTGENDLQGEDHGRRDVTYYMTTDAGAKVSAHGYYSHGVRTGKHQTLYNDGSQLIEEYVNGERDSSVTISKDGVERRDFFLDRQRQLKRSSEEFYARTAQEESDRRSANNAAMLSGLATGLANIAAETSSSSSSTSSSSYSSNGGDSNSAAWLTSKKSKVEGTASAPVVDRRRISHGSVYIQYGSALEYKTLAEAQTHADRIARGNAKVWNDQYDREDEQRALRGR